ncbi:MAG TPA: DUF6624 domain-containing protein [Gemmatimonadaceae bacterium]|nr:DUF6624 domain-containing protein [Gemmatimonadaceae bacterium]
MRTVAIIVLVLLGCRVAPRRTANEDGRALRAALLQREADDQGAREALVAAMSAGQAPDSLAIDRVRTVDVANTAWLKEVVARHGWPGRRLVERDGAAAAFLLVQHADHDTAWQAQVLPLLERAHEISDMEGQHVALLTDRVAVARDRPQVYGTQSVVRDGRIVLRPIADSAGVDARRAHLGLPPLAVYLRMLDSVYRRRP